MFRIFEFNGLINLPINWLARVLGVIFFPRIFWLRKNYRQILLSKFFIILHGEFKAIFGKISYPGSTFLTVRLFVFVFFNNFLGLFPYIFTSSRHGRITLALAFPLWVGHIIWAFRFNLETRLAHFVPLSTPPLLIPLIVLIELIRRLIRPFTLAIRLAANIIAGHLLLILLREKIVDSRVSIFVGVLVGLLALLVLELAVRIIQAYVFRLLSTLYLNEVNRSAFV